MTSCVSTQEMGLAPIQASGSVGTRALVRQGAEGEQEVSTQANATLNAQTYIWQPWFATVDGTLDLAQDYAQTDTDDSTALLAAGSLALNVLPLSRYPATLRIAHTDSRVDGEQASADFTRDSVSLNARAVITPTIRSTLTASYDAVGQGDQGDQTRTRIAVTGEKTFGDDEAFLGINSLSLGLEFAQSQFDSGVSSADDFNETVLLGTLRYRAEPFDNLVTDSSTSVLLRDETSGTETVGQFNIQGISTAIWRPAEYPFTVTGLLRTLYETLENGGPNAPGDVTNSLAVGSVNLTWPVSTNLSVSGGVRALYEDFEQAPGNAVAVSSETNGARIGGAVFGSASYSSDTSEIAGFDWRWNASSNVDTGFDTLEGADYTVSANFGHSFERTVEAPLFGPVRAALSQDVGTSVNRDDGVVPTATHAASLTYNGSTADTSSYVRLGVRDTRELAGDMDEFQSVDMIFNRTAIIDRRRQWFGNAAIQVSRQVSEGDSEIFISANGAVGYREAPFFDIDGLIFTSEVQFNALGLNELVTTRDDTERRSDIFTADWRNRVDYRIGLLSAGIEAGAFLRGSGVGALLLFRVRRDISGFGF